MSKMPLNLLKSLVLTVRGNVGEAKFVHLIAMLVLTSWQL